MPATPKMIKFAEDLIERCGYYTEDYDLEDMTFEEVSELIDELKEELGWDGDWGSYYARRRE